MKILFLALCMLLMVTALTAVIREMFNGKK